MPAGPLIAIQPSPLGMFEVDTHTTLELVASESLDVFDQQVKVESVRRRRNESEMLIEPAGVLVLGVDRQGADAGDVGGLECPQHRILEQTSTDPSALRSATDREPREQHDRHGMAGQALGQPFGAS